MKQREYILKSLKEDREFVAVNKIKNSTYRCKIWLQPASAQFLYNDSFFDYDVIKQLIDEKIINYLKIDVHQGDKMLLYVPDFTHLAFK